MMKLDNFVGMMTGHFDNKDQLSEKFNPALYHEKDGIWEGGSTSQFSPVMTLRNLEWRRHRHWKNIIMKKFEK